MSDNPGAPKAHQRIKATPDMQKAVSGSFRDMIAGYPFLASFASSDSIFYHAVNDPKLPVALTDGSATYFNANPPTKDNRGGWFHMIPDEKVFVHAHETLHVMREDCLIAAVFAAAGYVTVPRTPACPSGKLPFKDKILQLAADASINSGLIADGVGKPPADVFLHPAITWQTTLNEGYAILWQEDEQNKNNPEKQHGSGKGPPSKDPLGGDQQAPGSMGDPEGDESQDSSQPQNPQDALKRAQQGAAEREVAVQRAISAARMAGHGSSCIEQMVSKSREPGIDWRSYIQGFLARAQGNSAYNFRRPARPPLMRELMGQEPFFSPSRAGHGCNLIWWFGDVSGSIGEAEHRATLASAVEMMRELNPRTLAVAWVDTEVVRVDVFTGAPGADALEDYYDRHPIPDGGGTDFNPPFEMVESLMNGGAHRTPPDMPESTLCDLIEAGRPDGAVYFTDLYGSAPEHAPDYPVLWVATTNQPHPWGERVTINPAELV